MKTRQLNRSLCYAFALLFVTGGCLCSAEISEREILNKLSIFANSEDGLGAGNSAYNSLVEDQRNLEPEIAHIIIQTNDSKIILSAFGVLTGRGRSSPDVEAAARLYIARVIARDKNAAVLSLNEEMAIGNALRYCDASSIKLDVETVQSLLRMDSAMVQELTVKYLLHSNSREALDLLRSYASLQQGRLASPKALKEIEVRLTDEKKTSRLNSTQKNIDRNESDSLSDADDSLKINDRTADTLSGKFSLWTILAAGVFVGIVGLVTIYCLRK